MWKNSSQNSKYLAYLGNNLNPFLPYFHEQMVHKQQDETKMDSLEVLTSETKKKMKVKS